MQLHGQVQVQQNQYLGTGTDTCTGTGTGTGSWSPPWLQPTRVFVHAGMRRTSHCLTPSLRSAHQIYICVHGWMPFPDRQRPCILLRKSNRIFFKHKKVILPFHESTYEKKYALISSVLLYTSWIWWDVVIVFWFSDCIKWGKFEKCAAKLISRSHNEIKYQCLSQLIRYCTEIND